MLTIEYTHIVTRNTLIIGLT